MARGQALPLDKVDAMWKAFKERQTYNHIAVTVGVSRATAKRYCEEGDPVRGIEAFWTRFQQRVLEVHRRVERKTIYTDVEQSKATRQQVMLVDQILLIAAKQMLAKIRSDKVTMTAFSKLWKTRNEIVKAMCPFEKVLVEETRETQAFEGWSGAELAYYSIHGKRPTEEQLKELRLAAEEGPDGAPIDVEAEHQRWGAEDDEDEEEEAEAVEG